MLNKMKSRLISEKRIIAIMVILAFATYAFATESDPSETVGFVKYECVITGETDLNLIAYPMDAGFTNASDLGNDIGVCDAVGKWDASGQGWIQASYVPPMGWMGDFAIDIGKPLMVNVTANTTWPSSKGVASSKMQIIKISKPNIIR